MAPAQAKAPPAEPHVKRPAPGTLQKQKLTVAQAAEQWLKADSTISQQKALKDEAAETLHAYFIRTKRHTYNDRISRERTGNTLVLDQEKVRAFLGAKLRDFQKRTKPGWTLKRLG